MFEIDILKGGFTNIFFPHCENQQNISVGTFGEKGILKTKYLGEIVPTERNVIRTILFSLLRYK